MVSVSRCGRQTVVYAGKQGSSSITHLFSQPKVSKSRVILRNCISSVHEPLLPVRPIFLELNAQCLRILRPCTLERSGFGMKTQTHNSPALTHVFKLFPRVKHEQNEINIYLCNKVQQQQHVSAVSPKNYFLWYFSDRRIFFTLRSTCFSSSCVRNWQIGGHFPEASAAGQRSP